MTVIKAYNKLPSISTRNLDFGGSSVCLDDGSVSISLAFSNPADLRRFADAVAEGVSRLEMEKRRDAMPDGPVGNNDGYTDGEAPHDVEECTDPRCEEPECRRQRDMLEADRRYDELRDREMEDKA